MRLNLRGEIADMNCEGFVAPDLEPMRISQSESRIQPSVPSGKNSFTSGPVQDDADPRCGPRPDDAAQLSFLGGVLNVFQTSATRAARHTAELSAAVRQQTYVVGSQALGKKMIQDLLTSN